MNVFIYFIKLIKNKQKIKFIKQLLHSITTSKKMQIPRFSEQLEYMIKSFSFMK